MSQNPNPAEKVFDRAMKDEAFRQELLRSPKEVLERELGITLPQGLTVQVHEETPTTHHLVLPLSALSAAGGASDAELEQARSNALWWGCITPGGFTTLNF